MNKKIKGKKLNNSLDKDVVMEIGSSNDFSVRPGKIRKKRKKNTISFTQVINKNDIKKELERGENEEALSKAGEMSEEVSLDKEAEQEESISIFVIVLILAVCFIVGIALGYLLYKIAIDSSAVVIVRSLIS